MPINMVWVFGIIRSLPLLERLSRPDVSGAWYYEIKYKKTARNPFRNMCVQYTARLNQDISGKVTGTSEKILDIEANGCKRSYVGEHRVITKISGQVSFSGEKKKWMLKLLVEEYGHIRQSSATHDLLLGWNAKQMSGEFSSTIADTTGPCRWRREPFLVL